ncbi:MAG: hypothetical protein P8104_07075 [Gammaproteobacteria bacterium]
MKVFSMLKDLGGLLLIVKDQRYLKKFYQETKKIPLDPPSAVSSVEQNGERSVCFVIHRLVDYGGGNASILKLGTALVSLGWSVKYVTIQPGVDEVDFQNYGQQLVPTVKGRFCRLSALHARLGVATSWHTAYFIKENRAHFDFCGYFIQDFEPGFSPISHLFWMGMETYRMGLINFSLGAWNANTILKFDPTVELEALTFPVDLTMYPTVKRTLRVCDEPLRVLVYMKRSFRRGSALVWRQLVELKRVFGDRVQIDVFGLFPLAFPLPFGRHLGKLKPAQLNELYTHYHVGVVSSFSNVSLVPFEMLSRGLPVIDYRAGSASAFFAENEILLVDLSLSGLVNIFQDIFSGKVDLNDVVSCGQANMSGRSWLDVATEFEALMQKRAVCCTEKVCAKGA